MSRNEQEQYAQDNLGNTNRKIDTIRASEGAVPTEDGGLAEFDGPGDTGAVTVLYDPPEHADAVYIDSVRAFNDTAETDEQFRLYELELDDDGNITSETRRSVDVNVPVGTDVTREYTGEEFTSAIGVESGFLGQIAVGVIVDHYEQNG